MNPVTVSVVLPPGLILNANDRTHWATKARIVSAIRGRAAQEWRKIDAPRMKKAHLEVILQFADTRRRDRSNWAPTVKAVVDGMVSGPGHGAPWKGVLPDDSDDFLLSEMVRIDPVNDPLLRLRRYGRKHGQSVRVTTVWTPA